MIRKLQGRCLSLGGHRVADRLLRHLHDAGDLSAYLIGLIVEREFGSQAKPHRFPRALFPILVGLLAACGLDDRAEARRTDLIPRLDSKSSGPSVGLVGHSV